MKEGVGPVGFSSVFAAGTASSQDATVLRWLLWIAIFVLPAIGALLLLRGLRDANRLPKDPVKVDYKGLHIEAPVLGEYVFVGFVLCVVGILLYVFLALHDFSDLEKQLAKARGAADAAQYFSVTLHMTLPAGLHIGSEGAAKLQCHYVLKLQPPVHWIDSGVDVGTGPDLTCPVFDITRDTVIQVLQLREIGTGKVIGEARNIYPLQPDASLQAPQ